MMGLGSTTMIRPSRWTWRTMVSSLSLLSLDFSDLAHFPKRYRVAFTDTIDVMVERTSRSIPHLFRFPRIGLSDILAPGPFFFAEVGGSRRL
jgi:hypothetical protein